MSLGVVIWGIMTGPRTAGGGDINPLAFPLKPKNGGESAV